MIPTHVANKIDSLKHNTADSIKKVQLSICPVWADIEWGNRYMYSLDGKKYPVEHGSVCLFIKGLKFKSLAKRRTKIAFRENMVNLVANEEIHPFLLFINNKFVKWSNIDIVHDYSYNYLIIKEPIPETKFPNSVNILHFPFNVDYTEQKVLKDGYTEIFRFDNEGKISYTGYNVISIKNDDILYYTSSAPLGYINNLDIPIDNEYKLYPQNVILFVNDELYFSNDIKMDDFNIMTVEKGRDFGSTIYYKIFYNKDCNSPIRNIIKPKNVSYMKELVRSYNTDPSKVPEYFDKLKEQFDFKYSANNYNLNIRAFANYIASYDASLFNDIYKEESNFITYSYTGAEIKAKLIDGIYLRMLRHKYNSRDTFVMIFVNGLLYANYNSIKYYTSSFILTVQDLNDDDKVEVIFVRNVNNNIIKSKCPETFESNDFFKTNELEIFSSESPDSIFNISDKSRLSYKVPFSIFNNKITIPSFYRDKELTFVAKNQFRYVYYNIQKRDYGVKLSPDFNYCHNPAQYMVFINGRRVRPDRYKLIMPKETTPFDDISLYFRLSLEVGDLVEVFYLPTEMTAFSEELDMSYDGYVNINKNDSLKSLSKDLYFIFVNGKKIPLVDIMDISTNTIKFISDIQTTFELDILGHIKPYEDLVKIMNQVSKWDSVIEGLGSGDINLLMNTYNAILPSEDDKNLINLSNESIVNEIIRDYFMKPGINKGEVIDYDYETDTFTYKDPEGNYIISTMDANKFINIADNLEEESE